jgi:uncharacterized alpha-E superfamily protein
MLGRAADNVYWMARYIERAENMARLLASTYHMTLMPATNGTATRHWQAPLEIAGDWKEFLARFGEVSSGNVIAYATLDTDNVNSIRNNIRRARENARSTRQDLTTEVWESINQTFIELERLSYPRMVEQGFHEVFDWIKERSHMFRGAVYGTMRRGDAFTFARLGTFMERSDNTARLLAAKWATLSTHPGRPLTAEDYYRWAALLRAFSAVKAYREVYTGLFEPRNVADLLILRADMPRSLTTCSGEVVRILEGLRRDAACTRAAEQIHARTKASRIDRILRSGIERFLLEFVARNHDLHGQIGKEFMLVT